MLQQGTNEAENTKAHYLLQEKSRARGADTALNVTVHKQYIGAAVSANPITSTATIFMFLLELEAFAILYELRTRRTP